MHVFIDESGSFTGYHDRSISVVGTLAIPSGKIPLILTKYAKIRKHFPIYKGEVKGRMLNEKQINEVVTLLVRNEVLFEITAIDLGFQNEDEITEYKRQHAEGMLARVLEFREPDREKIKDACLQIKRSSNPLYVQAIVTFELLKDIIDHVPLYFSQRRPKELGSFSWVIDGKEPKKVTNWEMWWSWYAVGALANMSRRRPQPVLEGADLTHYDHYRMEREGETGTDGKLLLGDLRFCSLIEPELELVDIVVNATRRTLVGSLGEAGWCNIPRLMIHRKEQYIKFLLLKDGSDRIHDAAYTRIVRQHFTSGGRSMLAPRFLRQIENEAI